MTEEELKQNFTMIDEGQIMSVAAKMLVRLVAAQEAIVHFANVDLETQIEEAIKTRAEELAAEMVADKSKRSFIGKK